jgi:hypothetical protein
MALKPTGVKILIVMVTAAAGAAIWFSGLLDVKKQEVVSTPAIAEEIPMAKPAPAESPRQETQPTPAPVPEPAANAPTSPSNDAFDALINKGKK